MNFGFLTRRHLVTVLIAVGVAVAAGVFAGVRTAQYVEYAAAAECSDANSNGNGNEGSCYTKVKAYVDDKRYKNKSRFDEWYLSFKDDPGVPRGWVSVPEEAYDALDKYKGVRLTLWKGSTVKLERLDDVWRTDDDPRHRFLWGMTSVLIVWPFAAFVVGTRIRDRSRTDGGHSLRRDPVSAGFVVLGVFTLLTAVFTDGTTPNLIATPVVWAITMGFMAFALVGRRQRNAESKDASARSA
jgi:hypothetical protein